MADNIPITPGSGGTLGADQIGGVWYVVDKMAFGPDGSLTRVQSVPGSGLPVEGITGGNPVPVSGTVTCQAGTNLNTSALALESGGHLASIDTKTPALTGGAVPVALTSAQVSALTPLSTVAITASALPLPAGAATAAKQPALGTAGVPSSDVISVQGVTSGQPIPVSAASWPLPTGAAADGTDGTGITPPSGGSGIRGWLSGIYKLLSNALAVSQSGSWSMNQGTGGSSAWKVDGSGVTQPVTGSVTANAGTNLNTSMLALESGGHLASVDGKIPALGQALAAASVPVVLPAAQVTALTPPTAVTANAGTNLNTSALALESGHIASIDGKIPSLGQALAAASVPVVLPSAQITALTPPTTVGLTGTIPLPSNAAQESGGNLATIAGAVSGGKVAISAASLPLPTGAAQDGTDATGVSQLSGGVGIRGWLSGIFSKLSGTLSVSQSSTPWSMAGNVASGAADSGNPVKVGGVYNSSAPTLSTGQRGDAQLDANGNLKVAIVTGGGSGSNLAASSTGSAVPAQADYVGVNVGGNLVGQSGVTLEGATFASTNLAAVGGVSLAFGQRTMSTSLPVCLASDQSALSVTVGAGSSTIGNVGLVAGSAIVGKFGIDQTTPGTTNLVQVGGSLPAGTNKLGLVAIDQTTPGTTNLVQVGGSLPAGSNTIGAISNTSFAATQSGTWTVAIASAQTIAVTNTGTFAVQAAQSGTWNIGTVTTVSAVTAITNALPAGTNNIGSVNVACTTTGGATPAVWVGTASTNATSVKGAAGTVYGLQLANNTSSAVWVKFFDKDSAPTVGTDTPVLVILVPAGGGNNPHFMTQGIAFSSGIAFAITANPALNDNTAVGAGVVVNVNYK